ncbi:hypothetical protein ABB37_07508 [Leptomonas pyrrhocoris]|uniref:CW-type domain-containing protein n=1 Tax=Leptomonas pyrrhocoris TaxID=157538 RepID=A0A0M9FVD2_LEPPY|nr:hypothetical protein ABB37_07508 [Leptomonas pyrrhocoris]XP_015655094.1 hypothetical protein ABB37_07508 [Leptomonas pyrrhocoris]XP_015655095.1 hypothetical protein ABB37_07508 [Leptomonas pyrrhocoris]KPA76654.1 hypothetical protein ABB37_07508 [Leptomonas pyrrhocoris]KPA76655.1 hypothetical protein ABB37_07508 [Leptomonas pyrrhocoris]KPA76656.1 hypothetical protein ABB37_07508 [Leptomonas pyrrhocoris]|eukprot:XP_015655093.1 hypothetical protein ABB37_07508 [Leptomonas pyrrhocoris]
MLNHADAVDAHVGVEVPHRAATALDETTGDTQTSSGGASSASQTEPRYIRLPDALFNLRCKYPTVTESVFLECTRCHQWVAVPVLHGIPDEVLEGDVARSAQGLDSIDKRTTPSGPLRHVAYDRLHLREQLSMEATAPHWNSPRLRERESQQQHAASNEAGAAPESSFSRGSDGRRSDSASSPGTFEQILKQFRRSRLGSSTSTAKANNEPTAPAHSCTRPLRYPLLYIPNPDTFVCAGWQCAWDADALADLRKEWMGSIYKALPMPAISEEALSSSSSALSPSLSSFPASPALSSKEPRQHCKAALNEVLAEELHVHRRRRPGRSYGGRLARFGDPDSEGGSLPALSLPTPPLSASSEAETPTNTTTTSNSTAATSECAMQLSHMQKAWVKAAALHLLRDGGDGKEEEEDGPARPRHPYTTPSSTSAATAANNGALLSAYCWAVCDACGKLRRVAQPFPGGAPFVCAMAVTTSSSCRAARDGSYTVSLTSSAVVAAEDNACNVSEVDGLMQCSMKLCETELIAAALSSPFLPYPLKSQLSSLRARHDGYGERAEAAMTSSSDRLSRADVTRVLLGEPLLRTIHTSVAEAILRGTKSPTSPTRRMPSSKERGASTSAKELQKDHENKTPQDEDDGVSAVAGFLQRSLPILRELARTIKKRGLTSLARQIQLTPAQIQAKREAVLRSSLLDGHQVSHSKDNGSSNANAASARPAGEDAASVEAERVKEEMKQEEQEEEKAQGDRTDAARAGGSATRPRTRGVPAAPPAATSAAASTTRKASAGATKSTSTDQKTGRTPRAGKEAPVDAPAVPEKPRRGRPPTRRLSACAAKSEEAKERSAAAAREDSDGDEARSRKRPRQGGAPHARKSESAEKGEVKKKGSKRVAEGQEDEDEEKEDDAWEVVHWVQCDRCSKWRVVPRRVSHRIKFWECKMRYDEKRGRATTCADPDEADLST